MNLRGFKETYKIKRSVSDPVMFRGLPLKLAKFNLLAIIIIAITCLMLSNINSIDPILLAVVGTIALTIVLRFIRKFYKKYGVNGYELAQRDKSLSSFIRADRSITDILKSKIK